MELLKFYFLNIFYYISFPKASEVCSEAESIEAYCNAIISSAFYSPLLILFGLVIISLKPKKFIRKLAFLASFFLSIFIISDALLKDISDPTKYGLENYFIVYYFWAFILFNITAISALFRYNKKLLISSIIFTLIISILLGFLSRGTFEANAALIGSYQIEGEFGNLFKAYNFIIWKVFAAFILSCSLVNLASGWVLKGEVKPKEFFKNLLLIFVLLPIIYLNLISLPIGNYFNKKDVSEAIDFIDKIKENVDKYYLENGEYPKVVVDYIEGKASDPWLLKRHEYFSLDIKGAYYFSRPKKYCFIFQNPNKDFGYYSLTSTRDWRYNEDVKGFEDVYLKLCDETDQSLENLVAGQIGLKDPDDLIGKMAIETNTLLSPAISKTISGDLHEKIIEYGDKDPEIYRYYGNAPEKYKKYFKQGGDLPSAEQIEGKNKK